jgi:hypothetical protein
MKQACLSAVFCNYPMAVSAAAPSNNTIHPRNDLIAAVEYIIANTPVRKILVETNGMADPLQSIKQFWFDE